MIQSETRERFILDLVRQLAGAEIFEVHFFSPRRVSGVERGVAVIAARQVEAAVVDAEIVEAVAEVVDGSGVEALGELAAEAAVEPAAPAPEGAAEEGEIVEPESMELESLDDSPYAPEPAAAAEVPDRYTVLTATYRHTLKGPDRGKWEVSVKAEADAPLVTVDQVVRGVQRRAEDTDEVERMTGDEIRAIVDARQPAAG